MYRESGLVSDLLKKIASDRLYKAVLDELHDDLAATRLRQRQMSKR